MQTASTSILLVGAVSIFSLLQYILSVSTHPGTSVNGTCHFSGLSATQSEPHKYALLLAQIPQSFLSQTPLQNWPLLLNEVSSKVQMWSSAAANLIHHWNSLLMYFCSDTVNRFIRIIFMEAPRVWHYKFLCERLLNIWVFR